MNDRLQAILGIALKTAEVAFPAAAPGLAIGEKILAHPEAVKDSMTQLDVAEAAFQVVENFKGVDVGNQVMFRVGCAQVEQGLRTIHAALLDRTDGTPAAPAA